VRSIKELHGIIGDTEIDTSKMDIILAHSLSKKSRDIMLKLARENNVNVSNVTDVAKSQSAAEPKVANDKATIIKTEKVNKV
jgi:hypothetical protein